MGSCTTFLEHILGATLTELSSRRTIHQVLGSDPANAANDLPLFLGCRGSGRNETGYINYYDGQMAGVRAWNIAKDDLEIAAMAKYALQYNDELLSQSSIPTWSDTGLCLPPPSTAI